ncbi:MAG: hypothetical protein JSW52_01175 [Candidatus Coatesbacteria bacterium]|nr:MAG: hypothetical protein JSW52_01175 [Candidatus Coatesbacteria bacterium]
MASHLTASCNALPPDDVVQDFPLCFKTVGAGDRTVEWRFGLAKFLFNEKIDVFVEDAVG